MSVFSELRGRWLIGIGSALLLISTARAHHAILPNFDLDRTVALKNATITEFKFVNPHVYIYLDVPGKAGSVSWRCEMAAATRLSRRGWTSATLVSGQVVSIDGALARREANVCHVSTITLADGSILSEDAGRPTPAEVAHILVSEAAAASRPKYLPNGQPNLGGPWVSTQTSLDMPEVEPTAAGRQAGAGLIREYDSPVLRCEPMNIIHDWFFEREPNEIYQSAEEITLQYGYLDIRRTIHLGQATHPEELTPSVTGHSIGWWEGDALVVDTIGFEPGILFHAASFGFSMYSDQWHVVERFEIGADGRSLIRSYAFEDPAFMTGVYAGEDHHTLTSEPYEPYGCEELSGTNNARPAGDGGGP